MFCKNCGMELKEDAVFCGGCGTLVKKEAPITAVEENPAEIIKELEKVDVNVLTPIEALNILNKLKSLI